MLSDDLMMCDVGLASLALRVLQLISALVGIFSCMTIYLWWLSQVFVRASLYLVEYINFTLRHEAFHQFVCSHCGYNLGTLARGLVSVQTS